VIKANDKRHHVPTTAEVERNEIIRRIFLAEVGVTLQVVLMDGITVADIRDHLRKRIEFYQNANMVEALKYGPSPKAVLNSHNPHHLNRST